jgi:P-type Ca2+ transporter type 2C
VAAIVLNALVMVLGTLHVYGVELGHTDEEGSDSTRASTVAFTTFVFFQMLNAFNCRSEDKSAFSLPLSRNRFFVWAVLGSVALQLLALYLPPLQYLFDTVPLTARDLLRCACYAVAVLCSDELRKWLMRRFWSGSRSVSARRLSIDRESLLVTTGTSKHRGE